MPMFLPKFPILPEEFESEIIPSLEYPPCQIVSPVIEAMVHGKTAAAIHERGPCTFDRCAGRFRR
jgi:hypothetical protein